ncbi:MAG: DNA-processing protein DprA [Clostridia bacterium]|nr:DNA-processing protein DprA [Clostridia bacterium]
MNTAYWIWLQMALGAGARTDAILSAFPTARALYESDDMTRRVSGVLTARHIERLEQTKLTDAERVLERCRRAGQTVCTPEDESFPDALRSLQDMPLALYARGDLSCLRDKLAIAVVGSRRASMYSLDVARQLCRDLVRAGAVIVSGCALGVDSAAHAGAIYGGGKTVGVLGCGLDARYLMQNAALREDVEKHGALLSEYPPGVEARGSNFPMRNRIISGLSAGVLVIEAGEKSGSLITARLAAEQGRDVFGVPGDLTSLDYTGVNRLIRDGAKPVFSARDVLAEYMWVYDDLTLEELQQQPLQPVKQAAPQVRERSQPKPEPVVRQPEFPLSDDARAVLAQFAQQALYTDDLVRATGFEPNRVFTALTELEICGLIKMINGKRYMLV